MGFQDAVFLPTSASFCATFVEHCDRFYYTLGTTICLQMSVARVSNGMPLLSTSAQQILFLCLSTFMQILKLSQHCGNYGPLHISPCNHI